MDRFAEKQRGRFFRVVKPDLDLVESLKEVGEREKLERLKEFYVDWYIKVKRDIRDEYNHLEVATKSEELEAVEKRIAMYIVFMEEMWKVVKKSEEAIKEIEENERYD